MKKFLTKITVDHGQVTEVNFEPICAADLPDVGIPAGAIVLWGSAEVPAGWALCDGANGTRDLRDRFPKGLAFIQKL